MGVTTVEYNNRMQQVENLLKSIDRPGDYCFFGKVQAYMPRLVVDDVGLVSFPVRPSQARALIGVSEQAPYGRGLETLVDTSVRDSWQVDSSKVRLGGTAWESTLGSMVDEVARGIGCSSDRLSAELYKLLVYEPGGFFAEHRDSEKKVGMVATLVVALPVEGDGGELVVRHNGRECVIDLQVAYPDELSYAAFYADCRHETRPLKSGHRVALVFNLILSGERSNEASRAPVYTQQASEITSMLTRWSEDSGAEEKIVWLLDHAYSEAGLSFDALKGIDVSVADVLATASRRADCMLLAAILSVREWGTPEYYGYDEDIDDDVIGYVDDSECWLESWKAEDGSCPEFGKLPLLPEELIPVGALDDAAPDDVDVEEAMGNAAPVIEHAYRNAALVIWPHARTVNVLASGGRKGVIEFAFSQIRNPSPRLGRGEILSLIGRLVDQWPREYYRSKGGERSIMLRLLATEPEKARPALSKFLREIVLAHYDTAEDDALADSAKVFGPEVMGRFLPALIERQFRVFPRSIPRLILRLSNQLALNGETDWRESLGMAVRAVSKGLPEALRIAADRGREFLVIKPEEFDSEAVSSILRLGWRFRLDAQTVDAAEAIASHPEVVSPERMLPIALETLSDYSAREGFSILWRLAAQALLSRSQTPPGPPTDWRIAVPSTCNCQACVRFKRFCSDPVSQRAVFAIRQDLRAHIRNTIKDHGLPMDTHTISQGSPYKLVCTKNRNDYKARLDQYAGDVKQMESLFQSPPTRSMPGDTAEWVIRLRAACARAKKAAQASMAP